MAIGGVMVDVALGVLGPLRVLRDSVPVHVAGPAKLELLALLAVRLGRSVPQEVLIDELWDGAPPRTAETTLHTHIAGLRRVLEPGRGSWGAASVLVRDE